MGASFFWAGFHEFREFIFMHRFLKKEMVALDVGANLGEYTLFMAKRLTAGKIFSFEPMYKMVSLLEENIKLNEFSNVQVCPFGLSDKNFVAQVHELDDPHEGLGTFYLGARKSMHATDVELRTLDSVFNSLNTDRVDFIKMDIEGSELHALRGGKNTIAKFRPYVLIEINALTYNAAGYTVADVLAFFAELNYTPSQVSKTGKLVECNSLPDFGNVIFVPR
jgi:FkbM family methyltransferase